MSLVEAVFGLLGVVAVASALLVVTTHQLVHAALWLVVTLGAVAGCYLLLSAEFVAWVQVLIYVGAVVVLLLFGLMLTKAPIGVSLDLDGPPLQRAAAAVVAVGLAAVVVRRGGAGLPRRADRARRRRRPRVVDVDRDRRVPGLGAALRGAVGAAARRPGRRHRAVPPRTSARNRIDEDRPVREGR